MGHPRIHIIALVGAGAICSSAIFCFFLMYFLPEGFVAMDSDLMEQDFSFSGNVEEEVTEEVAMEPDPFVLAVALLNNEMQPLTVRREAAFTLAREGTSEALMELLLATATASPFLKAAIADALGEMDHWDAHRLLVRLLHDEEEMVSRAAVRSLVGIGDPRGLELVSDVLQDRGEPLVVRAEVAMALGRCNHPEASKILLDALESASGYTEGEAVFYQIQEALAQQNRTDHHGMVPESSQFWSSPVKRRASESTAGFLVEFLTDVDPEVRRTAARSLSGAPKRISYTPTIVERLKWESEADVRAYLYQALEGNAGLSGDAILVVLRREPNFEARISGYNLLASVVSSGASASVIDFFNKQAVPELKQAALQDGNVAIRFLAIIALQRSRTMDSSHALREISRSSKDARVKEAALAATDGMTFAPYATNR